ncbi:hypothetical protein PHYPSEUDO_001447 [Phytophthora pseudosyringae]|uniref:Uncharacterized protein n=1 Tax=Phytophthora pseudosyringae TaxID=221518 RepID=A0A8T1VW21_9STRA|nr:hypothetical protein PHYPSEUDO_001447 [Phytophthora pseudosyringae]
MNGDVAAASRPPLPPKPRAPNRSRKQREREAPDVDWERSLQHFAAAVSDDLDELHARFLQESELSFTTWKRLWTHARMSAAFHVEFWESSPTNTHKTVLQQTLDALVGCIEERDGEFQSAADVAALVGRVFALYCAYSVQLGDPKHKIDVDPHAWTALLTVNCVVCGVGGTLHPTAARQVRAMMRRLVVEEGAFLRCLRGFGPSVRVRERTVRALDAGGAAAAQDLALVADNATDRDAPVKQSKVEQLKSLSDRYQELMGRTQSVGSSLSGASAQLGGRRGKPAALAPQFSTREAGNDGQSLARALLSYMEYKANEEARRKDRVARAAAVREHESRNMVEQTSSERDGRSNILALSDRSSVMSVPSSPIARSVASIQHGSHRRRDSVNSEAFLAELETELHADISSDQVESATSPMRRNKQFSAISEISEADSDALADLERELEQSVDAVSSRSKEKEVAEQPSPPARQKRGRPAAGIVSRKAVRVEPATIRRQTAEHHDKRFSAISEISEADSDALADLERELEQSIAALSSRSKEKTVAEQPSPPARQKRGRPAAGIAPRKSSRTATSTQKPGHAVEHARSTARRARSGSVASRLSFADSWAAASTTDTDGLVEIQAELDAIPTLAGPLEACRESVFRDPNTCARQCSSESRNSPMQLPAAKPNSKARNRPAAAGLRRSARLSSVASDTESDGLEDLMAELDSTPAAAPAVANAKKPRARAVTSRKQHTRARGVTPNRSQAAKKAPKAARTPRASRQTQTKQKSAAVEKVATKRPSREPPAAPVNPPSSRRSTRSSSVALDSDSDGLAELEAELQAGA